MSSETRQLARLYLSSLHGSFWKWSDGGTTLVWSDGSTIAFRDEIQKVLSVFSDRSLPSFSAIVLALAACRPNWALDHPGVTILTQMSLAFDDRPSNLWSMEPALADVFKGFTKIQSLAPELRISAPAKASLISVLFESADPADDRVPSDTSLAIAEQVQEGFAGLDLDIPIYTDPFSNLQEALSQLQKAFRAFEPGSLALRLRTGLDELPSPAALASPIDVPACIRVRRLIEELRTDSELSSLVRLARDVIAAIQMPRPVSTPDHTDAGGVSDISNKGSLDRLVLSELAHDPLTLAVRVALGEAIYLRREFFPQTPKGGRFVLLDSGIRLWGVPRLFATAVAMALAATTDRHVEPKVFRASQSASLPVDFTSREGLVKHLESLEPEPDPAAALPHFLAQARASGDAAEAILITHPDVLDDPDFKPALLELGSESLYVITVDRDGQMTLLLVNPKGRRLLSRATLKLDDLFRDPLAPPATRLRTSDKALPALFNVDFPFLLYARPSTHHFAQNPVLGVVGVGGRNLLYWPAPAKGARKLATLLPSGQVLWVGLDNAANARALVELPTGPPYVLVTHNLRDASHNIVKILSGAGSGSDASVWNTGNILCIMHTWTAAAYSLLTGELITRTEFRDNWLWIASGRFFQRRDGWHAVTFADRKFHIDKIADATTNLIGIVESALHHEPIGIQSDGSIVSLPDGKIIRHIEKVQSNLHLENRITKIRAVSADRQRIAVEFTRHSNSIGLVDLATGVVSPAGANWSRSFALFAGNARVWRALQHRFVGVEFDDVHFTLSLIGRRESRHDLSLNSTLKELFFRSVGKLHRRSGNFRAFVPCQFESPHPLPAGVSLHVSNFADGSRIFIDSRGLLHLKSADPAVPEISIVLAVSTAMAGWISDGRTFGDPFFHAAPPTSTGVDAEVVIRQFVERLR